MISLIRTVLVTYCLFCSLAAFATGECKPLSLAELVDTALLNNPSTKQAWWNAKRAAAAVGNAKSAYYPRIDLEADATHGREFQFINGPDTTYTIVGANLVLSMMLYDFGERDANVCAAKKALIAANWQTNWVMQKVMIRVIENGYGLMYAQEALRAAQISVDEAGKVLDAATDLNHAGLNSIADVYTAQANLSLMKMELIQQEALLDIQKGKLAASMGLPADTPMRIGVLEQIPERQILCSDNLIALAYRQRADFIAKQARVSETVSQWERTRAAYLPKLSLNAKGGANHALHDHTNAGQYRIGLTFDVPLYNGFETVYKTRMAYADTQISMEELAELQLNIALEVLSYGRTLEGAQKTLPEVENYLKYSTEAYEGVLEKYRAGKEGIAELSNAQLQLARARLRYSDVKTKWLLSIANLAYATGTLL
jgi:outer membrane protein TolC